MKILVAGPLAAAGLELLRSQRDWEVVETNPNDFHPHLHDADALVVRSSARVTREVLAQAPKLRVVARAGVGVDNVDVPAATEAGVLVTNVPGGNAISVAELTIALMLGMARRIPEADSSTRAGRWEKRRLLGCELRGKTLGVVGLGSIGREVVRRACAFEMRILAYDPYISTQTAAELRVDLVTLDKLYAHSDYISLHLALTPETNKLLDARAFAKMKRGVRIINTARGELIDTKALNDAMQAGKVGGAGLDVFDIEPPPPDYELFENSGVIATPHIGGSTDEALEFVHTTMARNLIEFLTTGIAMNALNMPPHTPEQFRSLASYVTLAERLGTFGAHISTGNPRGLRITYFGKIAQSNTNLLKSAAVAGVLNRSLAKKANLVNAMSLAQERGWNISEKHESRQTHVDSIRIELETEAARVTVEGSVIFGTPRLIQVDGIFCEAPLDGHVTFLRHDDLPGVLGYVGSIFGKNSINIAKFALGREEEPQGEGVPHEAISVTETDDRVPDKVLVQLLKNEAIKMARVVEFT
jgi:D-3-phosphoglycerate dehydrogenase / 2-oxoglutarate reductase